MNKKENSIRHFIHTRINTWVLGIAMSVVLLGLVIFAEIDKMFSILIVIAVFSVFLYSVLDAKNRITVILELDEDEE